MLSDRERKILRILYNFNSGRKRFPTLQELATKTGRHQNELVFIINRLQKQLFIEWDGQSTGSIIIHKGWEEPVNHAIPDYTRFMD